MSLSSAKVRHICTSNLTITSLSTSTELELATPLINSTPSTPLQVLSRRMRMDADVARIASNLEIIQHKLKHSTGYQLILLFISVNYIIQLLGSLCFLAVYWATHLDYNTIHNNSDGYFYEDSVFNDSDVALMLISIALSIGLCGQKCGYDAYKDQNQEKHQLFTSVCNIMTVIQIIVLAIYILWISPNFQLVLQFIIVNVLANIVQLKNAKSFISLIHERERLRKDMCLQNTNLWV